VAERLTFVQAEEFDKLDVLRKNKQKKLKKGIPFVDK